MSLYTLQFKIQFVIWILIWNVGLRSLRTHNWNHYWSGMRGQSLKQYSTLCHDILIYCCFYETCWTERLLQ